MAFDFGLRRIGIAVGDTVSRGARPLRTVTSVAGQPDWATIVREVRALGPAVLVVGSPYNDDGSPGRIATDADRFALELGRRTGLAVERADERYSSFAAAEELRSRRASGERRRLQKGDLDSAAAAVILSSWLGGTP